MANYVCNRGNMVEGRTYRKGENGKHYFCFSINFKILFYSFLVVLLIFLVLRFIKTRCYFGTCMETQYYGLCHALYDSSEYQIIINFSSFFFVYGKLLKYFVVVNINRSYVNTPPKWINLNRTNNDVRKKMKR